MEAGAQDRTLAHRNNVPRIVLDDGLRNARLHLVDSARQLGQDLDILRENLLHHGRADEDAREGGRVGLGGEKGQVERRLEALNLAAKVVAVDADVEAADELLAALFGGVGLVGEEDEAGAGSPDGLLLGSEESTLALCMDMYIMRIGAYWTKSRSGSSSPDCCATNEIVVLSPPGMIRASHRVSSSLVRTSMASKAAASAALWEKTMLAALRSRVRCSMKPPWRAKTPTVRAIIFER